MDLTLGQILPYFVGLGGLFAFIANVLANSKKLQDLVLRTKERDSTFKEIISRQHTLNEELVQVIQEISIKNDKEHESLWEKIKELKKEHQKLTIQVAEISLKVEHKKGY
jgi:hypothetical protein